MRRITGHAEGGGIMDGIKFINSRYIQNYLRKIDYRISSEQILSELIGRNKRFKDLSEVLKDKCRKED